MKTDAIKIFKAGVSAVNPESAVKKYCKVKNNKLYINKNCYDLNKFEKIFVIGAGKATASMAYAIENILEDKITIGIINVKYGYVKKLKKIKQIEAAHPIPDKNGFNGAKEILSLLDKATDKDLVIFLISGGGSALLAAPFKNISLDDLKKTNSTLLECGADIHEMNAIRKHLSHIKGGNLAKKAYPATIVSLIVSDVVGDDLDVIASGPTVFDLSTFKDCIDIIKKYNISDRLPKTVIDHLEDGCIGKILETPKQNEAYFKNTKNIIIASNYEAIKAAEAHAKSLGYNTIILSSLIEGETSQIAKMHTAIAKQVVKTQNPIKTPACILSGGETIVTIRGNGKGGRNQEFALVCALEIANWEKILVLSAGTDGTDGPTDAAGAIVDYNTIKNGRKLNLDAKKYLKNNDSYNFFKQTKELLITGPTNTNVMDLRIMLIK